VGGCYKRFCQVEATPLPRRVAFFRLQDRPGVSSVLETSENEPSSRRQRLPIAPTVESRCARTAEWSAVVSHSAITAMRIMWRIPACEKLPKAKGTPSEQCVEIGMQPKRRSTHANLQPCNISVLLKRTGADYLIGEGSPLPDLRVWSGGRAK